MVRCNNFSKILDAIKIPFKDLILFFPPTCHLVLDVNSSLSSTTLGTILRLIDARVTFFRDIWKSSGLLQPHGSSAGVRSKSQKLESAISDWNQYWMQIESRFFAPFTPGRPILLSCFSLRRACTRHPLCFSIFSSSCYTSLLSLSPAPDRGRAREFDGSH